MNREDRPATLDPLVERLNVEFERTLKRNIKGLTYIASAAPTVGETPRDLLYKNGTLNLFHYRPLASEIYRVPLLVVMATTNRGYILDLSPQLSFVRFLLEAGYDVYMIDWTPPAADEKSLRLEDYTQRFIPECVRRVQATSGQSDVTLLGYCMGGVLALLYAATHPEGPMKNLVCFTTPVDFSAMKLFSKWSSERHFDVDRLVDTLGNVPSELIFTSFEMLRPATRAASQVKLWDNMWNDEHVKSFRMFERWSTDTLPIAGEYFRQTIKDLIWGNALCTTTFRLGGKAVDLRTITVPLLHVLAEHDHIVPYEAAKPLVRGVASKDREEIVLKGGHVSVVAGPSAKDRLWPKLDDWLGARSV